jgi:hypothetical protein
VCESYLCDIYFIPHTFNFVTKNSNLSDQSREVLEYGFCGEKPIIFVQGWGFLGIQNENFRQFLKKKGP